jgi:hypothetical protein
VLVVDCSVKEKDMVDFRKWISAFAAVAALLIAGTDLDAQNRTTFAGQRSAIDYAYGVNPATPQWLEVSAGGGTTVTGTGTLTVNLGYVVAADGTTFSPLNINAPVTVGAGATLETVTPTAVNCNTPTIYSTCNFTASFTYVHGTGEHIVSGTIGLQEAINLQNAAGGGAVLLTPSWTVFGGTNSNITSAAVFSSVYLQDERGNNGGIGSGKSLFWTVQPTTLTTISAPSVLTSTTTSFSGTGTWSNTSYDICITYVDILGGESACSTAYSSTNGTANQGLNITAPAASTGAVGWRAYGGTSSTAMYELATTSSNCTLTTLENVMNACAMSSNGVWPTLFVSTTYLFPVALGVTNQNTPVPQSHTTFAYEPSSATPVSFQTNYGPFGSGTIASCTASDNCPLGTFELPTGYLNQIGRTVRLTGKIRLTAGASSTLGIYVGTVWPGGVTAGAPVAVCSTISGFVFATAASVIDYDCTMQTDAVGATAVGTIAPESWFLGNTAAGTGTTSPQGVENTATTIGSLGLFAQQQFTVYIVPLVAADTVAQLYSLHIETLQ